MEKIRLDELLVRQELCESREQARRLVMAQDVEVEGHPGPLKPSLRLDAATKVIVRKKPPYVSRGGEKLEAALSAFTISPRGLVYADIGASTGGFTDCLLKHGATRVYAIDVGRGQLHESLRKDPRVHVMERVNARYLTAAALPERVDGMTIDVSFISLRLLWRAAAALLKKGGHCIALVKPQFEAGPRKVEKGGVVSRAEIHRTVLEQVIESAGLQGFTLRGLTHSPLLGPAGNVEFFGWWKHTDISFEKNAGQDIIQKVVENAHVALLSMKRRGYCD